MFDYETFRINLKLSRKKLKITQEDIANSIDVSVKTISRIENSEIEPNLPTVIGILNYLNCSVEQFMTKTDDYERKTIINKINDYIDQLSEDEKNMLMKMLQEYNKGVDWKWKKLIRKLFRLI